MTQTDVTEAAVKSAALLEEGISYLSRGDALNAYKAFCKSLFCFPNHIRAERYIQESREMLSNHGHALAYYNKAVASREQFPERALHLIKKCRDLWPESKKARQLAVELYVCVARLYLAADQPNYVEALIHFTRAVELSPDLDVLSEIEMCRLEIYNDNSKRRDRSSEFFAFAVNAYMDFNPRRALYCAMVSNWWHSSVEANRLIGDIVKNFQSNHASLFDEWLVDASQCLDSYVSYVS